MNQPRITKQRGQSARRMRDLQWFARAALLLTLVACVTRTRNYALELTGEGSVQTKVERAKNAVTKERLNRLKAEVIERLPGLELRHLSKMGLRWFVRHPQGGTVKRDAVTVVISVVDDGSVDAARVVDVAASILEPELNPPPQ